MRISLFTLVIIITIDQECTTQLVVSRGLAEVEKPILLDSFLPASMQIIAYLTDLMKYETKPANIATTTTTVRPTPFHKPGIYSPLGPVSQFLRSHVASDLNTKSDVARSSNALPDDLLGVEVASLLKLLTDADVDRSVSDRDRVQMFSENYDDWYRKGQFIVGNKRPPPTKAYVTLLSLYDQLNRESKALHLNKYGGYTGEVLRVLESTSKSTSAEQLYVVLDNLIKRRDSKEPKVHSKVAELLKDFEDPKSYLHDALKYIPPLQFVV